MNLYNAVLAATFGRRASRPLRRAYIKLAVLMLASAAIGLLALQTIPDLPQAAGGNQLLNLLRGVLAVQVTVFITNVMFSSAASPTDTICRILLTLPLTRRQLNMALLIPSFVATSCGLALLIPSLSELQIQLGVHPALYILSVGIGTLSAYGLLYGRLSKTLLTVLGLAVAYAEYRLAGLISSGELKPLPCTILLVVVCLLCLRALYETRHLSDPYLRIAKTKNIGALGLKMPVWSIKKALRAASFRFSFGVCLALSSLAAIVCRKYHLAHEPAFIVAAQVLAASLASDIRSTARQKQPPEIITLRGSFSYTTRTLLTGTAAAFAAVAPLLAVLITAPGADILAITVQVTAGVALGALVGFIIVPTGRDISGQLAAGLLCLALTLLPSRVIGLENQSCPFYGLLALGALGLAYLIEYKRNTYTWRLV